MAVGMNIQAEQAKQIKQLQEMYQSEKMKKLAEVIPDTKVCKNLTGLDKVTFHQYVKSLEYKSGITQQEINQIFKLDGLEFLGAAYDLALEKLNIPQNLKIDINITNQLNPAMYHPGIELLTMDPSIMDLPKPKIFNALRHELQHYKQNLSIYRHENIGEKAVEFYAEKIASESRKINDSLMEKSEEELISMGVTEEGLAQLKQFKELKQNDPQAYDKMYEDNYKNNIVALTNFRNAAVSEMGIIKADSPEGKRAERYFEDFQNLFNNNSYYNDDKSVNVQKYFQSKIEDEALLAGERWEADVLDKCYYKAMKDTALQMLKGNFDS